MLVEDLLSEISVMNKNKVVEGDRVNGFVYLGGV